MGRKSRINVPKEQLVDYCRRNQIRTLSLFGSVLREDFRADSDIDVLVEFEAAAKPSLFDLIRIGEDLTALLGRKVDLVEKAGLRNPFRRFEILRSQEVIFG